MAALPDLMAQDAPEAPPQANPAMVPPNPQEVLDSLLTAAKVAAQNSAGAQDTREMAEASKASLAFAQAWAILNPQLDPAGLPLDHHVQMEQVRGAAQLALEQQRGENAIAVAKETARAPTPVKSIKVNRDSTGRASSYESS